MSENTVTVELPRHLTVYARDWWVADMTNTCATCGAAPGDPCEFEASTWPSGKVWPAHTCVLGRSGHQDRHTAHYMKVLARYTAGDYNTPDYRQTLVHHYDQELAALRDTPTRVRWTRNMGPRPEHVVLVTRTTRYGNPFKAGENARDREHAVARHEAWINNLVDEDVITTPSGRSYDRRIVVGNIKQLIPGCNRRDQLPDIAGRILACDCPDDGGPCHADTLRRYADHETAYRLATLRAAGRLDGMNPADFA